jgi:hypothetical protein
MEQGSRSALKEWAAIEQVLGAGEQCVLLRKGGIWERREGFEVEHREFWLFPTLFHQNPHELKPGLEWALEAGRAAHLGPDQVRIRLYAVVEDAYRVESLDALQRVRDLHPLTDQTVEARFRYRNRPYLHLLVLRVHRAPEDQVIPNTPDYEGCISWVELDDPLPTAGAVPVLDDDAFAAHRAAVRAALEGVPGVSRV